MALFCPCINKDVFVIAVSGEVGGVNALVYTDVPFTILTSLKYPGNG